MDWRSDPRVWDIGNQFMFGPALLVNPVTEPGATSRSVYLPDAATWYDFWTGNRLRSGQSIQADAPLDRIPLYVKAGSIIPMGPVIQYASQAPNAPIELRVYQGANGSFTFYEDEGNNYDYEKGMYAVIPITWNESINTLTIGAREGTFPGMDKDRVFRIVWVGTDHGAGPEVVKNADREVHYVGKALEIHAH
jgi:alpha-D-xyloside xylohydrolase